MRPRQTNRFADPQPGVRKKLEEQPPPFRKSVEQKRELSSRQCLRDLPLRLLVGGAGRHPHALNRVRSQLTVLDRGREHCRERGAEFLDRRRGGTGPAHLPKQIAYVRGLDLGQSPCAPSRHRVLLDRPPVLGPRRLREAACGATGVRLDPVGEVIIESDPRHGSTITRVPAPLCFPCLGKSPERFHMLLASGAPNDGVRTRAAPTLAGLDVTPEYARRAGLLEFARDYGTPDSGGREANRLAL